MKEKNSNTHINLSCKGTRKRKTNEAQCEYKEENNKEINEIVLKIIEKINETKSWSFFYDFIYLFLERGERRKKERERNIDVWLPLASPQPGTFPQPRHVP